MHSQNARRVDDSIFVEFDLHFTIKNVGGVAAYKWQLIIDQLKAPAEGRHSDYLFDRAKFPPYSGVRHGGISLDPTILPSLSTKETKHLGVFLQPSAKQVALETDLLRLFSNETELWYRIVSEFSRGESKKTKIADYLDVAKVARWIISEIEGAQK